MSAEVADECNKVFGLELTGEPERALADLMLKAKGRELDTWKLSRVYSPVR